MTKLELAKKIISWHSTEGVKIRKKNEKKDCFGRTIWAGDLAYYDLLKYFEDKSEFSDLEIDFIIYSQHRDLLERSEFLKVCPDLMKYEENFILNKILNEQNHYLLRFIKGDGYFPYQKKTFLEENCCYNLTHFSKYYYDYVIIKDGKLKRQLPEPGFISLGPSLLKKEKKLIFSGFYELDSKILEIPVFNIEAQNDKEVGIILFDKTKMNRDKKVVMARDQFEKLNSFGNYVRDVYCPISYMEV